MFELHLKLGSYLSFALSLLDQRRTN